MPARPHRRLSSSARLVAGLLLLLAMAGGTTQAAARPAVPTLSEPVNDFARVIDPTSAARLDQYVRMLQAATGDVIIVTTIRTYTPEWASLQEYAVTQFENNGRGIGDKDKDNGVLVVLAVEDRQVWIEVGYGLEGAITDGFAGETSRLTMAPSFKQGQYGAGLLNGVARLIGRIADERNVDVADLPRIARQRPQSSREPQGIPLGFLLGVVGLLILIAWLNSRHGGTTGRGRRGGWGGSTYRGSQWGGSSWSGWSGGGSFSGGSFGGGFGGFGGGGSGGGGGGASW
jgi:uncharacterized protein